MRAWVGLFVLLPLIAACSDVRMLGAAAAEQRRVMNDMQARAAMAAVCDMSLGAYLRALNAVERRYAGLVCGDVEAMREAFVPSRLPEQLQAAEPGVALDQAHVEARGEARGEGQGARY